MQKDPKVDNYPNGESQKVNFIYQGRTFLVLRYDAKDIDTVKKLWV